MLNRSSPHPLHRYPLIDTTDATEFRQSLRMAFGAYDLQIDADQPAFQATRCHLKLRNLDLIFSACSTACQVTFPEIDQVKQQFVLSKSAATSFGRSRYVVSPHHTAVIPPNIPVKLEYAAGFEQLIFRIDSSAIRDKLSTVIGEPITRKIEFAPPASFENPKLQRLRRYLHFMVTELDRDGDDISPLVLIELEQSLILSFLLANRHNFSDVIERAPPDVASWQVRRVERYIEAHWDLPITIDALAAAAGASARSIFKTFRHTRGCSPMAFVKTIRLNYARRLLQAPEAATTVAAIAGACGFVNAGHFARAYRVAFGELPSTTLSRAKRGRIETSR